MKWMVRTIALMLTTVIALMGLPWVASESGEVVVVTTRDGNGALHVTRLWVVDLEGSAWLRSGSPDAAWYQRLQKTPHILMERSGVSADYQAVSEPSQRDRVNDLMRAKYGWADRLIALMFGREDAIPLRLVGS